MSIRRSGIVALLAAVVMLALAGCVRFQADLRVNPDDTVDGSVIVAVIVGDAADAEQSAAASADQIEDALLPNLRGAPGVTREVYEDDDYLGSRFTFSGTPLDAFAGGGEDGSISLERDGEEFEFTGSIDFTPDGEEPPADADTSNITVSVRFPGGVIEHNGEASGNTVTWRTSFEGSIDMHARASAEASGPPTWTWGIVAGVLLVLAAVTVFVVRRRRSA